MAVPRSRASPRIGPAWASLVEVSVTAAKATTGTRPTRKERRMDSSGFCAFWRTYHGRAATVRVSGYGARLRRPPPSQWLGGKLAPRSGSARATELYGRGQKIFPRPPTKSPRSAVADRQDLDLHLPGGPADHHHVPGPLAEQRPADRGPPAYSPHRAVGLV